MGDKGLTELPPAGSEEQKQKTRYFSNFALQNFSAFRMHEQGGILAKKEGWRNVSQHCLAEAVVADILAEGLGADRKLAGTSALLHDWYKRREIETIRARKGELGAEQGKIEGLKESYEADEKAMREAGISEEIIKIAGSVVPDPEQYRARGERSLEEKIMHWIDLSMQDTTLVNFRDRINTADTTTAFGAYSEAQRSEYAGKSVSEVDVEYLEKDQQEFERALGIEPGTLIAWINQKLHERITGK